MEKKAPLLSIGIIFRNDIRCIEHCLKNLQPLRDAIPSELIMADTGSEGGSREIAEKYADILIDFPWINDFSAARNSVMDEASGKWFLTVDTDEYLNEDADFTQFAAFLSDENPQGHTLATVIVRNHDSYTLDGNYTDFMATRLLRMSTGIRYQGAIHEQWALPAHLFRMTAVPYIIFDHDGYVELGSDTEKGAKKRERNIKLLREKLKKSPDSILVRLQMIESGGLEEDYLDQVRAGVKLVKRKVDGWESFGPPVLRYAVYAADARKLPELEKWVALAQEMFPESMYTRLDIEYALFVRSWNENNYADCVERGERFLEAMEDFRAGKDPMARAFSVLKMGNEIQEQGVKIVLSSAYSYEGKLEQALKLLEGLNYPLLNGKQTMDLVKSAQEIHFRSNLDTAPLITAIWDGINTPKPSKKLADHRVKVFAWTAGLSFLPQNRKLEQAKEEFCRNGYSLYWPLEGMCEIGNAAAAMRLADTAALESVLGKVEDWDSFPIQALAHALESGAEFPLAGRPLAIEDMDGLARRLAQEKGEIFGLAVRAADRDLSGWQALTWARGLAIAAVRVFEWKKAEGENAERPEEEKEQGVRLARGFAKVEGAFIARYYRADMLSGEAIYTLPPMHRFGWYCTQAFEALDSGDAAGYVRLLRAGLELYRDVAEMVEFLLDCTPGLQAPQPPSELLALAEQIRTVLANFAPDDPAVAALKQSEAYQKVAYLIEGLEPPVVGGLWQ